MMCSVHLKLVLLAYALALRRVIAFTSARHFRCSASLTPPSRFATSSELHLSETPQSAAGNKDLLQSIRSLRAKEIKSQLESLNISTANAFEKEELVQRLYRARLSGTVDSTETVRKKKKKRRFDDDGVLLDDSVSDVSSNHQADNVSPRETLYSQNNVGDTIDDATVKAPLHFYTLDSNKQLQDRTSQDVFIRPSPGKYAAIKVKLQSKQSLASVEYTLLVDTACSGIVLSPKAVSRSYGIIQTVKGAASMTTAGGGQGGYDVATWGDRSTTKFIVGGINVNDIEGMGSSMMNMAAINDIGALPDGLDGILGLSFLNKVSSDVRYYRQVVITISHYKCKILYINPV
jgi:hypothetical protein